MSFLICIFEGPNHKEKIAPCTSYVKRKIWREEKAEKDVLEAKEEPVWAQ